MDALTGSIGDLSDNVEHGMAWHGMAQPSIFIHPSSQPFRHTLHPSVIQFHGAF